MGGGGYVAGPGRARRASLRRIPLVLTEADSHLGPDQPRCSRRSPGGCASPSRSTGRDGARYRVTGRPVPAAGRRPRRRARARFGIAAARDAACSSSAARWAPARSTRPRSRPSRDAPFRVLHVAGRARLSRSSPAAAATALRPARRTSTPFGEALAAADLVVARAGGSVLRDRRARPPGDPRSPTRTRPADHQTTNARWMADAGAAVVLRRRRAHAERLRALGDGQDPRRPGAAARRWRGPRPSWRGRDAAQDVARELLAAAEKRD